MCVGCAMAATSAATGLRTWIQNRHFGWLTARRMKMLTLGAMSAAALVSTVGLSGSSSAAPHARAQGVRADTVPASHLGP